MKKRKLVLTPEEQEDRARTKRLLADIQVAKLGPLGHAFKRRHADRRRTVRKGSW